MALFNAKTPTARIAATPKPVKDGWETAVLHVDSTAIMGGLKYAVLQKTQYKKGEPTVYEPRAVIIDAGMLDKVRADPRAFCREKCSVPFSMVRLLNPFLAELSKAQEEAEAEESAKPAKARKAS